MIPYYRLLIIFLVSMACCRSKTSFTEGELRSYIRNDDNGLVKRFETENADVEVFYWPKFFVIQNQSYESSDSVRSAINKQIDSIDYFMLRYIPKTKRNLSDLQYNFQGTAKVIVGKQIIDLLDAGITPRLDVTKSIDMLLAFKSYFDKRKNYEKVVLQLNENFDGERITFYEKDISAIQNISTINN